METILAHVVTMALLFTVGFTREAEPALTAPADNQPVAYTNSCTGYTDDDNDGFCDNCNSYHYNKSICSGYADADNDGLCDNCSSHHYNKNICSNYADADNDGFCDNCNNHHSNPGSNCTGYVDADSDGICDNHAYGEACPYSPADNSNNSEAVTSGSYNGGHHRNSGHHGHGHH